MSGNDSRLPARSMMVLANGTAMPPYVCWSAIAGGASAITAARVIAPLIGGQGAFVLALGVFLAVGLGVGIPFQRRDERLGRFYYEPVTIRAAVVEPGCWMLSAEPPRGRWITRVDEVTEDLAGLRYVLRGADGSEATSDRGGMVTIARFSRPLTRLEGER